jgi:hypothetical protein
VDAVCGCAGLPTLLDTRSQRLKRLAGGIDDHRPAIAAAARQVLHPCRPIPEPAGH